MENECDAQSAFIKSSRFARYHNSQFSIFNSQFVFTKIKKLLSQISSWDRSEYALAVPPRLTQTASTLLTHQTMRAPLITGESPSQLLGRSRSPCPAEVHSHGPCLPQSHRLRLSWRFGLPATRLRHWFVLVLLLVWSQYIRKNSGLSSVICEKTIYYFYYKFLL